MKLIVGRSLVTTSPNVILHVDTVLIKGGKKK